jgi:phenylacetate-coenzyme A ligase PaaK-like adenylate-forming protein
MQGTFMDWSQEDRDAVTVARINQLITTATHNTDMFANKGIPEEITSLKDLDIVPILDREGFTQFMNPETGLGFSAGFNDDQSEWVVSQSGGTSTGIATKTRRANREFMSACERTSPWFSFLNNNTLWSVIYEAGRPVFQPIWDGVNGLRVELGKDESEDLVRDRLARFGPTALHGAARDLFKQVRVLQKMNGEEKIKSALDKITHVIFGGEFISPTGRDDLHAALPNASFISHYSTSQTGTIAISEDSLPAGMHRLTEDVTHTRIVDPVSLKTVPEGEWGSVVVIPLHALQTPIPGGFLLGDSGRIVTIDGKRCIQLAGRVDDQVNVAAKKFPAAFLIEEAQNWLKNANATLNFGRAGQIVKKTERKVIIRLEVEGLEVIQEMRLNRSLGAELLTACLQKVNPKPDSERSFSEVEVVIELNPSGVIKEKGRMKKIPQFVDETAVQVTNEYHI